MGLNDLIREIQAEDWLTPLIEASTGSEPEGWGEPATFARPSSAGGDCPREVQLNVLGYRSGFTAKSLRRMSNGTWGHTRWNEWLEKAGVLYAAEMRLTFFADDSFITDLGSKKKLTKKMIDERGGIVWSGETDLMFRKPEDADAEDFEIYMGEIKTMNARRFSKLPKQDPDHQLMARKMLKSESTYTRQFIQYRVMFEKAGFKISDTMIWLMENTDTQDFKVLFMKPDDLMLKDAFRRAKLAIAANREGILIDPPVNHIKNSTYCRYCYKKAICYAIQDGDEEACQNVQTALKKVQKEHKRLDRKLPVAKVIPLEAL